MTKTQYDPRRTFFRDELGTRDEWLEADGLGGFASGCTDLTRTRKYHGLLLAATTPPHGRVMLVNAIEATLTIEGRRVELSSHRYGNGAVHPHGRENVLAFAPTPWPRWTFDVGDGVELQFEILVTRNRPAACLSWRLSRPVESAALVVRPLISARDPHALHFENTVLDASFTSIGATTSWRPYAPQPAIHAFFNGRYEHRPDWYRGFEYDEERARGYDSREDLWSPGELHFDLTQGEAALVLHADGELARSKLEVSDAQSWVEGARFAERARRSSFASPLELAADAYIVRRGSGATVIAGYPWFGDWGRDTFIALRGLCIATGRLREAESILREWSEHVSEGMLPNRFADAGGAAEYNAVDASLWFIIAAHELAHARVRAGDPLSREATDQLGRATERILERFAAGTRHGICADDDGLLRAGEPGVQLTWMDARVGTRVITPRIGKPVEIQALWINALAIAAERGRKWRALLARATTSFTTRFWNSDSGCLFDVIDVDHARGVNDASVRPNQLFAVGGLPLQLVQGERARSIVAVCEEHLWTPLGPRSLDPHDASHRLRYSGGVVERDEAYHQGTVWPWLAGAFVEAWVRVHGDDDAARDEARKRFLDPLLAHLDHSGLGHVSEVADAEAPHTPGGCPFQAWSVGELLRLERSVLARRDPVATQAAR